MARPTDRSSGGEELRAWLYEREYELVAAALTGPGWHQGKPIDPPPPPPDVDAKIAVVGSLAWILASDLRALVDGEAVRLYRRDLPDWHPARRAGALSDALVLTEHDELIEA